jgi:hypothetical protein
MLLDLVTLKSHDGDSLLTMNTQEIAARQFQSDAREKSWREGPLFEGSNRFYGRNARKYTEDKHLSKK